MIISLSTQFLGYFRESRIQWLNGELQYPSFSPSSGSHRSTGIGETSFYDNTCSPISNNAQRKQGTNFGAFLAPMMPRSTTILQVPARTPLEISSSCGIQGSFFPMDRRLSTASKVFNDLPGIISKGVTFATVAGRSAPTSLIECLVLQNTSSKDGYDAIAKIFARPLEPRTASWLRLSLVTAT